MAFVPNGTIRLLAGVPLDNSYTHTLKYGSSAAQTAAFTAKTKKVYEHCTYIRETARIRIPDDYNSVIMCNYLMYQNADFGNKWFYAFITGVYYINDHATEIEFELDVMQTWAFDYDILPGFIERNHTATDVYGENLIEEPLHVNNYYCYDIKPNIFREWSMVMYATFSPVDWQYHGGDNENGVYSALEANEIGRVTITMNNNVPSYTWTVSPSATLQSLFTSHPQLVENVAAIVMLPTTLLSHPTQQVIVDRPVAGFSFATPLETYTPRNKKLLTFPYTKLNVSDGNGGSRDYKFEQFEIWGGNVQFLIHADKAPDMSISCTPNYYSNIDADITESIVMSNFPMCSWISSAYIDYLSRNMSSLANRGMNIISDTASGAASFYYSNGAQGTGEMLGALKSIVTTYIEANQEFRKGYTAHGIVSNTSFYTLGKRGFEFRTLGAKLEELKTFDDFFDMFGYAIHRVGVPNTDVRPYWCYVKMVSSAIKPSGIDGLPASDMRKIESVLNNGVTFWKDMGNVGNYTLNNTV